jgi:hypothetical protein
MSQFLVEFLMGARQAFTRRAAFAWFVVVFAGLALRSDWLGATSIVRALDLSPGLYQSLLHFFHASSWSGPLLLDWCVQWLAKNGLLFRKNGRIVIDGDETKTPKEGRRMPGVKTLRQTSETSSKPSYFRGHEWAVLGVLIGGTGRLFCAPAWAELLGVDRDHESAKGPRSARIVTAASQLADRLGFRAYVNLDAFYATGPVFRAANSTANIIVVTRAKKNFRAYLPAKLCTVRRRGRPRKYAGSLRVNELYDSDPSLFQTRTANVYGRPENIRVLARVLYWKPAAALVLFVLVQTSASRITLMCSDIHTDSVDVLELYCHRPLIEVTFDTIKNLLGLMEYRFWSNSLEPQSRRPARNTTERHSANPDATEQTLAAIVNFVHVGLVLLAFLQAFACKFTDQVSAEADCWLRTPSGPVPSEFVAKLALGSIIRRFLRDSRPNPMAEIIHAKMRPPRSDDTVRRAA